MCHSYARRALPLLVALLLVCGCSDKGDDSDGGGSGNPVSPSTSNNPPPSGVVLVTGNWSGTSNFQQNGRFYPSNLSATITQTDRQVQGNVTFTSPEFTGWVATITGQLSGDAPTSQFFGNITVTATPVSGGGNCTGTVALSGQTQRNTLRWEAPSMRFVPIGSTAGNTVCLGDVFTVVWTLSR